MSDRAVRNLENLRRSASTARVLNLLKVAEENEGLPEWAARPLFRTPALNTSLIIKHRLRRNETDLFFGRRQVATKVIVPIDRDDLGAGGRFLFVNQSGFELALADSFGLASDHEDVRILRLLDDLPSLDPFLLREHLKRGGVEPAPCYFNLSEADLEKMLAFVQSEIQPLVALSLGVGAGAGAAEKMAAKILSSAPGDTMDALGATLRLNAEQYQEGVFCWKGFLYYKWTLNSMTKDVRTVADQVARVRPVGPLDGQAKEYIERGRTVLRRHILTTCADVAKTLRIYDEAYLGLTERDDPLAFRDFLLAAPSMFARLGDQLGAIQHIISFWTFRFGPKASPVAVDELIDIFMDFESGLSGRGEDPPDPPPVQGTA